ncbi:hypothetical protein AVEN_4465-1 [Araneus ventricosus]|uniref:Uncharacterized protein n=1 Tax=Araneus ventricosus TaxID=182803 RepID=A0A4Y2UT72_ARAVE|nr:hypothetical protein AVEN_4465-1 [Araneus ventricosus]
MGEEIPHICFTTQFGNASTLSGWENGLYLVGSICGIPCWWTQVQVQLGKSGLVRKLKERLIYKIPNISCKSAIGKKREHGKLDVSIDCGSRKFKDRVYIADSIDS